MKVTTDGCLFGAWVANEMRGDTNHNMKTMLDVGAGSGLLSLMVAQKSEALIEAVEIDAAAALQAKENIAASPWKDTINVINGDVLQWKPQHQYDCIFSNPPFYENDLKSVKTVKNIAHHGDGLRLADLLLFINDYLKEDGSFFLLLPAKRLMEAGKMMIENGLHIHQKVLVKQTPRHEPFRVMIEGRKSKGEKKIESTMIIANDKGYTSEFIFLLKDYYLYL